MATRNFSGTKLSSDRIDESVNYVNKIEDLEQADSRYYVHRTEIKIILMYLVLAIFGVILAFLTIIFIGEIVSNKDFRDVVLDTILENLTGIIFAGLAILGFSSMASRE